MELEHVDLDCGRIYFIGGVHPANIWQKRKKASLKSYLKSKNEIEEGLNKSNGLAGEAVILTKNIKNHNPNNTIKKLKGGVFNPKNCIHYEVLKCIKKNKDYYFCDVIESPSKLRTLVTAIIPTAALGELCVIIGLSGSEAAGLAYAIFASIFIGTGLKARLAPRKQSVEISRKLENILTPMRCCIYKFAEITTAIQLITILEVNKEKYGENNAITYFSHGMHTDAVKKYVKKPVEELEKELVKLTQIEKVYKTYFRPPIRIPISEWSAEKRENLLEKAKKNGFDLEKI